MRVAAQLLQQGDLSLPVGKNLPVGLERRQVLALKYEPMFGVPIKLRRGGPVALGQAGKTRGGGAGAGQSGCTLGVGGASAEGAGRGEERGGPG